ncbi:MAG: cell wall hydrolase, partial [Sphingomonas sp.]|nr:cell wall hydrolase [Sphingomonas sp.]
MALIVAMAAVSARAAIVVMAVAAQRDAHDRPDAPPLPKLASMTAPLAAPASDAQPPASQPAPASGTTGTAPLPAMPVPASYQPLPTLDGTIHPAPPFSMNRAGSGDYGRALNCLTTAIYYESASEPDAGQRAVAQVILNRVRHPAFPATVCGVVYQGSERAGCQFSFACDGAMARIPSRSGWARALHNAALMLSGTVEAQVGTATHYHTYAVTPAWNR